MSEPSDEKPLSKSERATEIALRALKRCMSVGPEEMFVLKFVPRRHAFKRLDEVRRRGPNLPDLPLGDMGGDDEDGEDWDDDYDPFEFERREMAAVMSHRSLLNSMFLDIRGSIQILNLRGDHLLSARTRYRDFICLVASHTNYPADPKKDKGFLKQQELKKDIPKAPFEVLVSTNGHSVNDLKKVRKKIRKSRQRRKT